MLMVLESVTHPCSFTGQKYVYVFKGAGDDGWVTREVVSRDLPLQLSIGDTVVFSKFPPAEGMSVETMDKLRAAISLPHF
jgi:hypothetical protein